MRRVSLLLAALVLAAPTAAQTQPTAKEWRIGWLSSGSSASDADIREAFHDELHRLGYAGDRRVHFQAQYAEGRPDRLRALAAEFARLKVDVLVTNGTPAALAAKQAIGTIPIVLVSAGDPVGSGLVASLARPGGNVTGVSAAFADIAAKWLELLRAVVPRISRVGFLGNRENLSNQRVLKQVEAAAAAMGIAVTAVSATTPAEIGRALTEMQSGRIQGGIVPGDPVIRSRRREIADFAARARLPMVYFGGDFVAAGGLMSYGPNRGAIGRQGAVYVDRILKGARPADLPVEEPTTFELVLNGKAAAALGLTFPPALRLRADRIVE